MSKELDEILEVVKKADLAINQQEALVDVLTNHPPPMNLMMASAMVKMFEYSNNRNNGLEPGEMIVPKRNFNQTTKRPTD